MNDRTKRIVLVSLGTIVLIILTIYILYGFVMEQRGYFAPGA